MLRPVYKTIKKIREKTWLVALLLAGFACLLALATSYAYHRSSRPTYVADVVHGSSPAEGITVKGTQSGLDLILAHNNDSAFIDDVKVGPEGIRLYGHDLYIDMVTMTGDAGIWEGSIPALHVTVELSPGRYVVHVASKKITGNPMFGNGESSKTFVKTVTVH